MASPDDSASDHAADETPKMGFFQCSKCQKTYNRADHLIRHVRSHTQEKPYVCQICKKGFARPDLLRRHVAGHEEDDNSDEGHKRRKRKPIPVSAVQTDRVSQACKACSQNKTKCSEGRPCDRCVRRKLDCVPLSPRPQQASPSEKKGRGPAVFQESIIDFSQDFQQSQLTRTTSIPLQTASTGRTPRGLSLSHQSVRQPTLISSTSGMHGEASELPDFTIHETQRLSASTVVERQEQDSIFPYNRHETGDFGSRTELWHSDDFQNAFQLGSQTTFVSYENTMSSMVQPGTFAGVGADAFQRSVIGSWRPGVEEPSLGERPTMTVPKNIDDGALFEGNRKKLPEPLSSSTRDKIIGLVLESGPQNTSYRVVQSFPSADFLTHCIEYYFSRHDDQIDSYIHLPTLQPNDEQPELVAMLAGAGAVCTASPVVRELGYALQEAVGYTLKRRVWSQSNPAALTLLMVTLVW